MHRIDNATREIDTHGPGKDGFTEGSPPTIPATIVTDDIANAWQEELARAVEASGQDLSKTSDFQTVVAHNRFGPSDFFYSPGPAGGAFHPQLPVTGGSTLWAVQTAGLTGEIKGGAVWVNGGLGRLFRLGITPAQIAAQGFDSHTFGALKDAYVAIFVTDSETIEINEVGNGAGAPVPTADFVNVLKVITDATDITGVEALYPAWPELITDSVRIAQIDDDDRETGSSKGFLMEVTESGGGDKILSMHPWETTSTRTAFWTIEDVASGGNGANVVSRANQFSHEGLSDGSNPFWRMRTHEGTAEEESQFATIRTFKANITGASFATIGSFTMDSKNTMNVFALITAADDTDATRSYNAILSTLVDSDGTEHGTGPLHENLPGGGAITSQINTDGTDVFVQFRAEAARTYRCTAFVIAVPSDRTA